MKTILNLCHALRAHAWVGAILISVSGVRAQMLFSDDFDTYPVGTFPAVNWTLVYNGTGDAAQYVDGTNRCGASGNSLHLWGARSWTATVTHTATLPLIVRLSANMMTKYNGGGSGIIGCLGLRNPSGTWGSRFGRFHFDCNGRMYLAQSDAIVVPLQAAGVPMTYIPGVWYGIVLDYDFSRTERHVHVQVNGTNCGAYVISTAGTPNSIELTAGNATNVEMWFDNIRLEAIPVSLSLERTNNAIALSWPVSFSDYGLKSLADVQTTNWLSVTNVPSVISDLNVVVLPLTNVQRFFRLVK